jgi:hypothetical protein
VNDILTAGNFLNYFGKTDLGCTGVGKVTVYPVVIRKVYPLIGVLYSMKCQPNSIITPSVLLYKV